MSYATYANSPNALDISMKEFEVLDKWKWDMSGQSHVSKIDQC